MGWTAQCPLAVKSETWRAHGSASRRTAAIVAPPSIAAHRVRTILWLRFPLRPRGALQHRLEADNFHPLDALQI